jgi:hypothetical protein
VSRTIDPDDLTGPERAAARAQARPVRDQVNASGGCFCCLNRDRDSEGWGRANCGLAPPAKFKGPTCAFRPDNDRIYCRGTVE